MDRHHEHSQPHAFLPTLLLAGTMTALGGHANGRSPHGEMARFRAIA
jgi:hypothetical protein